MTMKIVAMFTLIMVFAGFCFSQTDEERSQQEQDERTREILDRATAASAPGYEGFVGTLISEETGSWTVVISRHGGILGNSSRLVTAAVSNGEYACDEGSDRFRMKFFDSGVNDTLNKIVGNANFKDLRKRFEAPSSYCSDCVVTRMEVLIRGKKRVKSHTFEWSLFPESNQQIRTLYDSILIAAKCE